MKGEKYITIGKLGKPHGISGAFRFLLEREPKSKNKLPGHFMIQHDDNYLPWFIEKIEWTGFNEGIILFEEINSPEKARAYNGNLLCLTESDTKTFFKANAGELDFLIGYKAILKLGEEPGTIKEISEMPGQTLLLIKRGDKEIMIPFAEDFVVDINKKKKEITFDLPDGLIDI
jgi:16S rRNA processing protein RimM